MSINLKLVALLAVGALLSGCGAGTSPIVGPAGEVGLEQARGHIDPVGDAFGTAGTNYDITKISVERRTGELFVTISFVQNVLLPPPGGNSTGNGTMLRGIVQLDTDQDSTTPSGVPNAVTANCPAPSGVGPEFRVRFFSRLTNGNYRVRQWNGANWVLSGEATPVLVRPNVLGLRIPYTALGGDDGRANVDMVLGNGSPAWTDCAPDNAGFITPM